jgi:ubiquinone/menaquinone biosynthesis C-methylase UbiE
MGKQSSDGQLRREMHRFYKNFSKYYTTNAYYQMITQANPERFTAYILEHMGEGDRVLELGSASGVMVMECARLVHLAVGIDVSKEAGRFAFRFAEVEKARYKLVEEFDNVDLRSEKVTTNAVFLASDAEMLPFKSQSFNVCFARDVLEHIVAWKEALDEMHRCLKLGGHLFLGIPIPKKIDLNLDYGEWAKHHGAMADRDALHRIHWDDIKRWATSKSMKIIRRDVFFDFGRFSHRLGMIINRYSFLLDSGWVAFAESLMFVHLQKGAK